MSTLKTTPLWFEVKPPSFDRLNASFSTDVVIVGGGVTGLTAAYLALSAGKRVCVLERNQIARGDSGHTTAHLTGLTDLRLGDLVKSFGEAGASLTWFAGFYAIEQIAEIIEKEKIDCEFRRVDGFLCESLVNQGDDAEALKEEMELAEKLGFEVDLVDRAPIVNGAAIRLQNQATFHAFKYLAGLAEAVQRLGGQIFEHSEVSGVEDKPLAVMVNGHRIDCEKVMIATHVPLQGKTPLASATILQTKLIPYTSYVIAGIAPGRGENAVSIWDTSNPYYYLRVDSFPEHDRVIFGGLDNKTGQVTDTKSKYERLAETLGVYFPQFEQTHRWSGQVIETADGLPYIGESAPGQFIATGFNGNGFTFATIAAIMFRDELLGESNPWKELFAIDRTILKSDVWEYLRSNLDYPYYMAADRLKWRGAKSANDLAKGEGKVISVGLDKIACARDRRGRVHQVSAVCPHLGCIVHWNNSEETWDCPCHGSRFRPNGEVIAGPAETPLADKSKVLQPADAVT